MDKKEKMLPATAWLIANSSSIMGRRGEMTVREEKFTYQRLQKRSRKNIFMVGMLKDSREYGNR
jgi:hypothetical protein